MVRLGSIQFGEVRFGWVRFSSVLFDSGSFRCVPFGSVLFGSVSSGSIPFRSIPLAGYTVVLNNIYDGISSMISIQVIIEASVLWATESYPSLVPVVLYRLPLLFISNASK